MSIILFFKFLFLFFLNLNFKTFLLKEINDDHFLTYITAITLIVSSIANLFWGILGDKKDKNLILKTLTIMLFFTCIIYGYSTSSKILLATFTILLGILDSGVITIMGPALTGYYGNKMG